MKNLLSLFLVIFLFASCQKDQTLNVEQLDQTTQTVENSFIAESDSPGEVNAKKATCNKVRVSSTVHTGSFQDVLDIQSSLLAGVSLHDPSICTVIYNSLNTVNWVSDIQTNFKFECANGGCTQYNMWLETTTVVCYGCSGIGAILCNYAQNGTNLSLAANSTGLSHLVYVPMGSAQIVDVVIDFNRILNPVYLC